MRLNPTRTRADRGAPAPRVCRPARSPLERLLAPAILVLTITLAGCLDGAGGETAEPNAGDTLAGETVPEELGSFGEVFVVKTCPDPFLSIMWPLDELQAYLPEGFVAGDAADATFGFGTPHYAPARVDADATPLGMIIIQATLCEGDEDPRTHYKEVLTAIYIETPAVPDVHRAATSDWFVVEHVVPTPWFADLMTQTGWNFTADATIEGVVEEGLVPSGTAKWRDAAGTGYHVEMAAPAGSPYLPYRDVVFRYWQVVPHGVVYFDHLASGAGAYATDFSCTTREGTALHVLLRRTDCEHPDAEYVPFVLMAHDPTLSFHYLHGVTVG